MQFKKQTFSALFLLAIGLTFTTSCTIEKTVTDVDGNIYKTVTIGTQTWMAENLKVTKYNDGTTIPNVTDAKARFTITTGAVCTNNFTTNADTIKTYGRLYNWYAVNTGKLCPTGWHVPSNAEWDTLQAYLIANGYNYGGSTTENKIAKAMASTKGWETSEYRTSEYRETIEFNPSTNNTSGFTALPAGSSGSCLFYGIGRSGYWWCSTEYSTISADGRALNYDDSNLISYNIHKSIGLSVRCLRD